MTDAERATRDALELGLYVGQVLRPLPLQSERVHASERRRVVDVRYSNGQDVLYVEWACESREDAAGGECHVWPGWHRGAMPADVFRAEHAPCL